jgi:hypothetical protein
MEKPMYRVLALAGRLLQNLQLHLRHGPETSLRAGGGMHSTEYQPINKVSALAMIKGKNYGRYNKSQKITAAEVTADTAADQQQPQEAKAEDPEENRRLAIEATKELLGLPKQETVENVDTSLNGQYNNNIKNGGNNYAGNQGLSGIDEAGLPRGTGAGRIRGMGAEQIQGNGQGSGGVEAGGNLGPGSMEAGSRGGGYEVQLRVSPVLRVSDNLSTAQENRGTPTYQVKDTTGQPKIYAAALVDGRNSDPANGWCVTPKSAQELKDGNVRTFMNDTGTVGVGVVEAGRQTS